MKQHLKKLVALLLAVALVLSLAGMAEELPVSEEALDFDDAPVYEEIPEDIPEELDIADLLILDDNAQETFADESESALAQEAAGEAVSNAIPSKVTIGVKEKYTIDTSSLSGKLTFKSSKTSIATVSSKGVVTGKKVGTAKITVTPKSGKKKTITVTVAKAPSKVTLNKTKATVTVGKTLQLKATLPSKTASNQLTWTTSNKNVATVNANGKVTAKKAGTATITVKTFNGKKATCKVTVEDDDEEDVDEEDDEDNRSYELRNYLGKSLDTLNKEIPDKLKFSDGEWKNKYFSVSVDDGIITGINLQHSIPLSEGGAKYQLYILSPGMEYSASNTRFLRFCLWEVYYTGGSGSTDLYLLENDSFPSYAMQIMVYKGIIRQVSIFHL